MGDRCYMHVTCRRQDRQKFEALGFELEFELSFECSIIEIADEEANYAHSGELPTDIPFLAWHGAGSNYGDGRMACDGKNRAEVSGNEDGFVVKWDSKKGKPTSQSLRRIRRYLAVHDRVRRMFQWLRRNPASTSVQPNPPAETRKSR